MQATRASNIFTEISAELYFMYESLSAFVSCDDIMKCMRESAFIIIIIIIAMIIIIINKYYNIIFFIKKYIFRCCQNINIVDLHLARFNIALKINTTAYYIHLNKNGAIVMHTSLSTFVFHNNLMKYMDQIFFYYENMLCSKVL